MVKQRSIFFSHVLFGTDPICPRECHITQSVDPSTRIHISKIKDDYINTAVNLLSQRKFCEAQAFRKVGYWNHSNDVNSFSKLGYHSSFTSTLQL